MRCLLHRFNVRKLAERGGIYFISELREMLQNLVYRTASFSTRYLLVTIAIQQGSDQTKLASGFQTASASRFFVVPALGEHLEERVKFTNCDNINYYY